MALWRPHQKLLVAALALSADAWALPPPAPLRAAPTSEPHPDATIERPSVDLRHIRWEGSRALAPDKVHGTAELTLDLELQRAASDLLKDADPLDGAATLVDVRTGELLALTERARDGSASKLISGARVPAASVFKLVTTASLFENTKVVPQDEVCITGGERGIERKHLEPPKSGDIHCNSFFQALGHSRNAAYAQLVTAHLLRSDLVATAELLGFNHDLPFDAKQTMGTLSVPYNDLAFARAATGFQGSTLSLLGGAHLATVIANGGVSERLRVVRRAGNYDAPSGPEYEERVFGPTTARRLTAMMEVTTRSGTARHAFVDEDGRRYLGNVRVAGKTGTLKPKADSATTSWFIGFAPADSPRVAIAVVLQNGNVWRRKASEVARDLLRVYFHEQKSPGVSAPEVLAER